MSVVLVAGGAGFIGSHLVDRLLGRGDRVVCVDNLCTGSRRNVERVVDEPAYRFVEHDVSRPDVAAAVAHDGERFDAVMHLASPASPPAYMALPIETLDVGSIGTRNLLEIARSHGARFLVTSTSEVYGDPLVHPQPESYLGNVNPVGERSVYDEAKRFAEAMTMAYLRTFGVDVKIARIFNTYGPRMQRDDGRVVTNFVHQALDGAPITIYGSGSQTRSFCYVDDQVEGLLRLLDSVEHGPINIGNEDEFTVRDFADLVIELTQSSSSVEIHPLPSDDPQVRCPDITLARELLGWEPSIDLRTGLQRTIEAYLAERRTEHSHV